MFTHAQTMNQRYSLMLDILSDIILNHASKLEAKGKMPNTQSLDWSFFLQKLDREADEEMDRELTAQLLGTYDFKIIA